MVTAPSRSSAKMLQAVSPAGPVPARPTRQGSPGRGTDSWTRCDLDPRSPFRRPGGAGAARAHRTASLVPRPPRRSLGPPRPPGALRPGRVAAATSITPRRERRPGGRRRPTDSMPRATPDSASRSRPGCWPARTTRRSRPASGSASTSSRPTPGCSSTSRDRLGAVDWIAAVVLGPRLFDGTGAGDPELAARLVGYNLGPLALDVHFGRPTDGGRRPRRRRRGPHRLRRRRDGLGDAGERPSLARPGRPDRRARARGGRGRRRGGLRARPRAGAGSRPSFGPTAGPSPPTGGPGGPASARPDDDQVPSAAVVVIPAAALEGFLARRIA